MPERAYLDANVLLRLLLYDEPGQAEAVAALLRESERSRPELRLASVTLAEIVFVLGGAVYRLERAAVAGVIEVILGLPITIEERDVAERALAIYRDDHPNWADAYLAACALLRANGRLVTFDRELKRLPELTAVSF